MKNRVTSKLRGAAKLLRETGARGFIIKILEITKVYRRVILGERDLDEPIPNIAASLPIVIELLEETELGDYIRFQPQTNPSVILNRLRAGHWCFVARHNGHIVHAGWVAFGVGPIGDLGLQISLSPDEAYAYNMYTAPEFRNQRVARARIAWTLAYLRKAGYRRVIGDVFPENKASQRSGEGLGFRSTGWLARIILGPLKITLYRPVRKPHPRIPKPMPETESIPPYRKT